MSTRREWMQRALLSLSTGALASTSLPAQGRASGGREGEARGAEIDIEAPGAAWPAPPVVLPRAQATLSLEPYAPNIVRVTLSLDRAQALAAPGYGFIARPEAAGWRAGSNARADLYRSPRLRVIAPKIPAQRPPRPNTPGWFFPGSTPPAPVIFLLPNGRPLLRLLGWSMSVPNHKDDNAGLANDLRPGDPPFYQVSATFDSPQDECYFGLGQNQEGYLDHRDHAVRCWHDYDAPAAPSVGIPFLVTNRGYGVIWDNPSKTTIVPGFNGQTRWISEVGNRVSFFLILGRDSDEIYAGYRRLTGPTPLLPKGAYGFIQCKQRYRTQAEVLAVARGYRERKLPADYIVVDWFYYTRMGQMDFKPAEWPDPAAMNRELHRLGFQSMISVWPRFAPGSRYYNFLRAQGWFEHLADGTPTDGLPYDRAGSDIDTTNPAAARWYWKVIRDNILSRGFDSLWADETEPDLPPDGSYFKIGPGTRYFNVYPLFHTAALYDGQRRDFPRRRVLTLARDAWLGAQRNGAMFWSSDIYPTWDTLRRQIPTGLNFTASGLAHWTQDIGGWQYLPPMHHPAHPPLLSPDDCRDNVGGYDDYPELYTRWFQYGAFLPVFRTHGSRRYNEVWSYGREAEPILAKYLKLRYQLLPYIYSLAWRTWQTGAPYMRALFMDFPGDQQALRLGSQFMFGPAFLVAPVTAQGQTRKRVYLPAGAEWYNYWTEERHSGGQWVEVEAPIEMLPLFVRAGSIVPFGKAILSAREPQAIAELRVYAGADARFELFDDDGQSYDYEQGRHYLTELRWHEARRRLTRGGKQRHPQAASWPVRVIGG